VALNFSPFSFVRFSLVKIGSVVARRFSFVIFLLAIACVAPLPSQGVPQAQSKSRSQASARTRRLQHINRAFVASTDLKPMAQQLLQNRTPQAYAGVQAYARKHQADDAGPLAHLVLGYAHNLDKDYAKALEDWRFASALSPALGDYLDYLRANAYQELQNSASVIKTLEGFEQKYPDSILVHDVAMLYGSALSANGQPEIAATWFEKHREPAQADIELALGRAYVGAGNKVKAADIFRRLYFSFPVRPEADAAAVELQSLGEAPPRGSFDERRTRAELLLKEKRYSQAANELSPLVELASTAALGELQSDFATALYHERRREDAQHLFESLSQAPTASAETKAEALYFLAEIARDKDDRDRHAALISQIRSTAPQSVWFQRALLSAGNMYLLRKDFEASLRFYSELYQSDRNGQFAAYAHWKAAWLSYRLRKKDDARKLFEEQVSLYPGSTEVSAAIYWRGRLAESESDQPLARAYYQKLSDNYRYYYYANLARERLIRIGVENVGDPAVLDRLPRPPSVVRNWETPAGNLRTQKAQLLANAALYDFAVKELQAAGGNGSSWQAKSAAQIYAEAGDYRRAIETLKRAVPSYFSANLTQLPRPIWETLFPRPYWVDLQRYSTAHQLDPYLVASLIRQESEFSAVAISRANAMGLMQILPTVGKKLAREEKIHSFSSDALLTPSINLQLGTRYFKQIVERYDGQVEYALAAYNAGEDRVKDWRSSGDYQDVEEFVESIPFTETREYVQAIMRNAVLYRLLYAKSSTQTAQTTKNLR